MNYILFDGPHRNALLPFTYTRPVADLRVGILTIREKWEAYLGLTTTTITEDYLSEKYPMVEMAQNIMINASYLPNQELVDQILNLKSHQALSDGDQIIAFFSEENQEEIDWNSYDIKPCGLDLISLEHTWDIFKHNGLALQADFEFLTHDKISQPLPDHVKATNPEHIFIEEGAVLEHCLLNASHGPIYIAKNAVVMDGCLVRGPFALGQDSVLKMGAKIYGPTTIGPYSKVGGEVNNSVIFGYSNKAHDGFLGNSVIGEWCNLGADTNTSNLKNNYAEVRLWDYETQGFAKTGLQFCGLMMGDHSKCGINTMFNTGTVIGVSANIFGSGFPRNFIPSFSWGGSSGYSTYLTKKAFEVAEVVMNRRGEVLDSNMSQILEQVFEMSKPFRKS